MRKSLSLIILAASLGFGGTSSCLAQDASDAKPNAKPGTQKQKMSNSRSGAGQAAAAKPSLSHREMRKRLKKSRTQSPQPQSKRTQPVAKR